MANKEQLKILQQGVAAWNEWREKNPELLHPDLGEADLREANLGEVNQANLLFADPGKLNLRRANLRGANLFRANLVKAKLGLADLQDAYLLKANLFGANLFKADLRGADLVEANLREAHLREADIRGANLREAHLSWADIGAANLSHADLSHADLSWTNFIRADLSHADLSHADIRWATLGEACLVRANLHEANLGAANLVKANLSWANLSGADLREAQLTETDLCSATLIGNKVYGASAWRIKVNDATRQQNLIITRYDEPAITVDNIKIAQFIYLLLNNQEIRDVIDIITSKAVLILGRFSKKRKPVLDAIRDELRKPEHDYLPIVFDFQPSANRTTIETIKILANMSRFVIADLTDARSVLQELQAIVPSLPSVAVRLLIKKSAHEYGMLDYTRKFGSVVKPTYEYESLEELIASIKKNVIGPAERKVKKLRQGN